MKKIGKRSKMQIKDDVVYLSLAKPFQKNLIYFFFFSLIFSIGTQWHEIINKEEFNWVFIIFNLVFFLFISLEVITYNKIEILTKKRTVVTHNNFLFFNYNKKGTVWPADSVLQYEVQYDTYNKITDVYLISKRNPDGKKKDYLRMIRFNDIDTFKDFQTEFNANFPLLTIREWNE